MYVKKNNGNKQKFVFRKLVHSINDALKHVSKANPKLSETLAKEAMEHLEGSGRKLVESDAIRQAVIHVMNHDNQKEASDSYQMTSLRIPNLKVHQVIKRDGRKEAFLPFKLFKAIKKSYLDAGIEPGMAPEELTKEVIKRLEKDHTDKTIQIEIIRKITAALLKEKKLAKVEKSYLLHKYL